MNLIKKVYKKILFICILIISITIFITLNNVVTKEKEESYEEKIRKYGEPINSDGLINNDFFGITNELSKNKETTKGINEAIEYANKNNIEYIKLKKDTYYIDGRTKDDTQEDKNKGICLKSNITFDLNGSTLKHITNSDTNYAVISILNQENIIIKNGIILGDKEEHVDSSGANDKGFGIDLRGGSYIVIENLYIGNLTGDGILMREVDIDNVTMLPHNIDVKDCIITNNRRQGISIISGNNINIYNNEIYNIAGKNPQACIDIESDGWKKQKNENINIYNNKLHGSNSKLAIMVYTGFRSGKIYDNEITGRVLISDVKNCLQIYNNNIKSGELIINKDYYTENNNFIVDKAIIKNNKFIDSEVKIEKNNYTIFGDNVLTNTKMSVNPTNFVLINNKSDKEIEILGEEGVLGSLNNKFEETKHNENINIIENEEDIQKLIQEIMLGVE